MEWGCEEGLVFLGRSWVGGVKCSSHRFGSSPVDDGLLVEMMALVDGWSKVGRGELLNSLHARELRGSTGARS